MEELQRQINELKAEIDSLKNASSIPFDVSSAFESRLSKTVATTSIKSASTETQAVDEGGTGTYSVAKAMDGFIKIIVNGIEYNVPFYN
jgi:hypothetical protein